jgi:hypothetical protein
MSRGGSAAAVAAAWRDGDRFGDYWRGAATPARFHRPDRAVRPQPGACLALSGRPAAREISANLYKSGVRAMPVTALVGFLIGVVLSYLSALQLKQFGADIFIVNIIGLGIVRELGPVLVAILVAGRSGSAMTAQLGVMRVTEEIDALATMGVPRGLRLVFPKVVALTVAMPLLVLWSDRDRAGRRHGFGADAARHFLRLLLPDPAARGAGRQPLDRSGQGGGIRHVRCPGGLPFRPAGAAKHRKPVHQHHGIRGDGDHRGDHPRCHFRHRHAGHWLAGL